MKLLTTVIAIIISVTYTFAQSKTEKLKVYGECGMCEQRIEKTAKAAGAATADWDDDTKMLTYTFNPKKTSSQKIEKALAAKGHDTEHFTSTKKAYELLPECCHYERKKG